MRITAICATARGVETYYTTTYSSIKARTADDDPALKNVNWTGVDIREKVTNSHRLADDIQHALYGGLAERNPEIRNRGVKEAQYVVLTGNSNACDPGGNFVRQQPG